MSYQYDDHDPQKIGAEYLEMLEKSLTDLRRLHRRCEAHGAVKSAEETFFADRGNWKKPSRSNTTFMTW